MAGSLRAVLAQIGLTLEVIVVDDASATPPPADVERLLSHDRVVCERLGEPRGRAAAVNFGVRRAHADWLAVLNEGDLWAPHHLATLLTTCDRAGADYGYGAAWLVDTQRRICGFRPAPAPDGIARTLLQENVLGTSSVVFRRALWERAGGFDEWLNELVEWDLWIRWSRVARPCMVSTATVASTVLGSADRDKQAAREFRELKRRYGRDAKRAGVRFGGGAHPATSERPVPPLDAMPPWLEHESPTESV